MPLRVEQASQSGSRTLPLAMIGTGAALFVSGYLITPSVILGNNLPGDTGALGFVPVLGPLLAVGNNPFLSQDSAAWAMAALSTAAQVLGLGVAAYGMLSLGNRRGSVAIIPTASPSGAGVALIFN